MDNCFFLRLKICPYHERSCDKSCDKYEIIGDANSKTFKEWNEIISNAKEAMKFKYFGGTKSE